MEHEREGLELHPNDKELFDKHPDPIMEGIMKQHIGCVNGTLPHYAPMLHFMLKAITGVNVLEIGVAQCYTSWFLAMAVKYNNDRFGSAGKYIGIDIGDKTAEFEAMKAQGLPVEFMHMDSLEALKILRTNTENHFDLIFQDGYHNTEHCLKEIALFYPMLKGKGNGYLICHDVYAYCEEYFKKITSKQHIYDFEYVRFLSNYGLAVCRKMKGYDYKHVHWPEGDQKIPGVM